jgi:hypothetical protein
MPPRFSPPPSPPLSFFSISLTVLFILQDVKKSARNPLLDDTDDDDDFPLQQVGSSGHIEISKIQILKRERVKKNFIFISYIILGQGLVNINIFFCPLEPSCCKGYISTDFLILVI